MTIDADAVSRTRPYEPPKARPNGPGDAAEDIALLPVVAASSLAGRPAPPRPWHVPDMIPGRQVTLLGGDGGVGKSILAMQLGVATAAGKPWLGLTPKFGPVVYLSAEDDQDELHRRLEAIAATYGLKLGDLSDLHLVPLAGLDAVLAAPSKHGVIAATPVWRGLLAVIERVQPRLVIVDTTADAYAGDENRRPEVRQFIGLLRGLAIRCDNAVLLLAHPSLIGMSSRSGTSGSTAWNNSVRSRLYLDKIKNKDDEEIDADVRVLSVKKSNYGPSDMEMRLRWKRGAFILYDGPAGGFDKLAAEAKADRVFLDLLDRYARQDRDVSPNHSNIYAPAMFEKHPNSEGITKKAFTAAMERLLAAEKILVEPTGPPSRRKQRLIVAPPRAEP